MAVREKFEAMGDWGWGEEGREEGVYIEGKWGGGGGL